MKARLKAEGKSPVILSDPLHDVDSYALKFGWAAFWALDDKERARVVATYQVEQEIEFVSSHWTQYGDTSARAILAEPPLAEEENPFKDW